MEQATVTLTKGTDRYNVKVEGVTIGWVSKIGSMWQAVIAVERAPGRWVGPKQYTRKDAVAVLLRNH